MQTGRVQCAFEGQLVVLSDDGRAGLVVAGGGRFWMPTALLSQVVPATPETDVTGGE